MGNNNAIANVPNSRKRTRAEMEREHDADNDDAFCDEHESRKERKHREWKERVQKENEKRRNKSANGTATKRRKIMSAKKSKPTAMFSIFEKAKKQKPKPVDKVKNEDIELPKAEIDDEKKKKNGNEEIISAG